MFRLGQIMLGMVGVGVFLAGALVLREVLRQCLAVCVCVCVCKFVKSLI